MKDTCEDIIYIQCKSKGNKSLGVVLRSSYNGAYEVYPYVLNGDLISPLPRVIFDSGNPQENYQSSQEFVKNQVGAEAMPYDWDSEVLRFHHSMEAVIKRHIDTS